MHAGTWLGEVEEDDEDCTIKPYIIGDGAFPLEPQLMKCYDRPDFVRQKHFNRALISTRQKIESAFGFYKGRWHVVVKNHIRDPSFMRDVALVCASLHNVYERASYPFNEKWIVNAVDYVQVGPAIAPVPPRNQPGACDVRHTLAQYVL